MTVDILIHSVHIKSCDRQRMKVSRLSQRAGYRRGVRGVHVGLCMKIACCSACTSNTAGPQHAQDVGCGFMTAVGHVPGGSMSLAVLHRGGHMPAVGMSV